MIKLKVIYLRLISILFFTVSLATTIAQTNPMVPGYTDFKQVHYSASDGLAPATPYLEAQDELKLDSGNNREA